MWCDAESESMLDVHRTRIVRSYFASHSYGCLWFDSATNCFRARQPMPFRLSLARPKTCLFWIIQSQFGKLLKWNAVRSIASNYLRENSQHWMSDWRCNRVINSAEYCWIYWKFKLIYWFLRMVFTLAKYQYRSNRIWKIALYISYKLFVIWMHGKGHWMDKITKYRPASPGNRKSKIAPPRQSSIPDYVCLCTRWHAVVFLVRSARISTHRSFEPATTTMRWIHSKT